MRLIDVKTLQLKEFFDNHPPYAILSHTWGSEEVIYQEYLTATQSNRKVDVDAIRGKAGFAKIMGACKRAHDDGLQYLWCDTNCIDKSSSAELTEAINSMYAWYRDSAVCYAYLADADGSTRSFARSRWFTRGWTLQELLAPSKLVFFDRHWKAMGDRKKFARGICVLTRIHIGALYDRDTIPEYSIAQRMSWAANRQTSRQEDIAYCLLGIFNVNMPLLYGEGLQAYQRLQREIINISDDQSLLVWVPSASSQRWTGALAPHPSAFKFSGSVVRDLGTSRLPSSVTNLGLSMSLPMIPTCHIHTVLVRLNCSRELRKNLPLEAKDSDIHGRYFQIWIPLHYMGNETYMRGHWPMSEIFLGTTYPLVAHSRTKSIFLAVNDGCSAISLPVKSPAAFGVRTSSFLPISELLITLNFGSTMPQGRILREAYPLDDVIVTHLRGSLVSSPALYSISNGNLCIILSIFWNENGQPQDWMHTTIPNPKLQPSRQNHLLNQWETLFPGAENSFSSPKAAISSLNALHAQLELKFRDDMRAFKQKEYYPLVWIRNTDQRDLHGQPVLAIEIVFREPPRTRNNGS